MLPDSAGFGLFVLAVVLRLVASQRFIVLSDVSIALGFASFVMAAVLFFAGVPKMLVAPCFRT